MTKPDYTKMRREVRRVLSENNIIAPPISPRELAENYGLRINEVFFDQAHENVAGFIDFLENAIYVNADDPFSRQTFTIAHEFGHSVLHRELFEKEPDRYKVLLRKPIGAETDPIEKEANAFAAHLLVPKKFLDEYWQYASVDDLSRLFSVSKDVVRNRLQFEYGA